MIHEAFVFGFMLHASTLGFEVMANSILRIMNIIEYNYVTRTVQVQLRAWGIWSLHAKENLCSPV